jgi:thiol-disulfide isomerase/thioredoxin
MRGKVVVINFWASWCLPCRAEMPDLQEVSEKYLDEGLVVLGVNTTYVDNRADALAFIEEFKLNFPILFDESGEVGEDLYSVISLPTSYWIDRNGTIQVIHVGAMSRDQMIDLAEMFLQP